MINHYWEALTVKLLTMIRHYKPQLVTMKHLFPMPWNVLQGTLRASRGIWSSARGACTVAKTSCSCAVRCDARKELPCWKRTTTTDAERCRRNCAAVGFGWPSCDFGSQFLIITTVVNHESEWLCMVKWRWELPSSMWSQQRPFAWSHMQTSIPQLVSSWVPLCEAVDPAWSCAICCMWQI